MQQDPSKLLFNILNYKTMKNLFLAIVLLIGQSSFAQDKPEFKCDVIKYDTETKMTELSGNVSFKTDIIALEKADKILVNNETNEIIVSGLAEFSFDGSIQIAEKAEMKIMRYRVGERIAYLE